MTGYKSRRPIDKTNSQNEPSISVIVCCLVLFLTLSLFLSLIICYCGTACGSNQHKSHVAIYIILYWMCNVHTLFLLINCCILLLLQCMNFPNPIWLAIIKYTQNSLICIAYFAYKIIFVNTKCVFILAETIAAHLCNKIFHN